MEFTPSKKRKIDEKTNETPSKKEMLESPSKMKKILNLKEKLDLIKRHNEGASVATIVHT